MIWSDLNTALSVLMTLTAVWSIARMNGTTRHCIRVGILAILVGALGQSLGVAFHQWEHYLDTILYAGVITLLVFNSRYKRRETN